MLVANEQSTLTDDMESNYYDAGIMEGTDRFYRCKLCRWGNENPEIHGLAIDQDKIMTLYKYDSECFVDHMLQCPFREYRDQIPEITVSSILNQKDISEPMKETDDETNEVVDSCPSTPGVEKAVQLQFKFQECDLTFDQESQLPTHLKKHEWPLHTPVVLTTRTRSATNSGSSPTEGSVKNRKEYICPSSPSPSSVKRMIVEFQCDECSLSFENELELQGHLDEHEWPLNTQTRPKVTPSGASFDFDQIPELTNDIPEAMEDTEDGTIEVVDKCPVTPGAEKTVQFKCQECDLTFDQESQLRTHLKNHEWPLHTPVVLTTRTRSATNSGSSPNDLNDGASGSGKNRKEGESALGKNRNKFARPSSPSPTVKKIKLEFQCHECSLSFDSETKLQIHLNVHEWPLHTPVILNTRTRPKVINSGGSVELKGMYSCPHCPRRFDTQSGMNRHKAAHNPVQKIARNSGGVLCNLCTKKFETRQALAAHNGQVHKLTCKPKAKATTAGTRRLSQKKVVLPEVDCMFCKYQSESAKMDKHFTRAHCIRLAQKRKDLSNYIKTGRMPVNLPKEDGEDLIEGETQYLCSLCGYITDIDDMKDHFMIDHYIDSSLKKYSKFQLYDIYKRPKIILHLPRRKSLLALQTEVSNSAVKLESDETEGPTVELPVYKFVKAGEYDPYKPKAKLACKFCFRTALDLEKHCESNHRIHAIDIYTEFLNEKTTCYLGSDGQSKQYLCSFCPERLGGKTQLNRHFRKHHHIYNSLAKKLTERDEIVVTPTVQRHTLLDLNKRKMILVEENDEVKVLGRSEPTNAFELEDVKLELVKEAEREVDENEFFFWNEYEDEDNEEGRDLAEFSPRVENEANDGEASGIYMESDMLVENENLVFNNVLVSEETGKESENHVLADKTEIFISDRKLKAELLPSILKQQETEENSVLGEQIYIANKENIPETTNGKEQLESVIGENNIAEKPVNGSGDHVVVVDKENIPENTISKPQPELNADERAPAETSDRPDSFILAVDVEMGQKDVSEIANSKEPLESDATDCVSNEPTKETDAMVIVIDDVVVDSVSTNVNPHPENPIDINSDFIVISDEDGLTDQGNIPNTTKSTQEYESKAVTCAAENQDSVDVVVLLDDDKENKPVFTRLKPIAETDDGESTAISKSDSSEDIVFIDEDITADKESVTEKTNHIEQCESAPGEAGKTETLKSCMFVEPETDADKEDLPQNTDSKKRGKLVEDVNDSFEKPESLDIGMFVEPDVAHYQEHIPETLISQKQSALILGEFAIMNEQENSNNAEFVGQTLVYNDTKQPFEDPMNLSMSAIENNFQDFMSSIGSSQEHQTDFVDPRDVDMSFNSAAAGNASVQAFFARDQTLSHLLDFIEISDNELSPEEDNESIVTVSDISTVEDDGFIRVPTTLGFIKLPRIRKEFMTAKQ